MTADLILRDCASGLFFRDVSQDGTSIALTQDRNAAVAFVDGCAVAAARDLSRLFGAFCFVAVERG